MITFAKIKRMFRGQVSVRTAVLETLRRVRSRLARRRERAELVLLNRLPARLGEEFARLTPEGLLAHFRSRQTPEFFPGFAAGAQQTAALQQERYPEETTELVNCAKRIANEHCWPLLGFGEKCFGAGEIDWNLDPLSGYDWPLAHHAEINLSRDDGSDVRVVWELNRMAHLITLGRAYAVTDNQRFSTEFFLQLATWREQNPVGRGVNWNCAMEVALRSMNLLAAFELFLRAPQMNETELAELLRMFDQHGLHIRRNLEYSHIATSNHYLADVVGLLWLGVSLPELAAAQEWREFGLQELFGEMDKQVLPDGADYEASTGYHRLKLELFLYSFVLCHINAIDIDQKHWTKLRGMLEYLSAYLRPDHSAPLIGDSDSGQAFPLVRRAGDDHGYLLALGAAVFQEPVFRIEDSPAPQELLWALGARGLDDYEALSAGEPASSRAFPDAGTYVLRHDDLYLLFNTSGSGVNGRGSHGHNDALSIEVSACGSIFIVDPGAYIYTGDLKERHRFRSTAYHSTVEVDQTEQNTTDEATPFLIGDEAHPQVISWESNPDTDSLTAEHGGYRRLSQPVTHRRSVYFRKRERFWTVDDSLSGEGTHDLAFRFHLAPGLDTSIRADGTVEVCDKMNGARLLIVARGLAAEPVLESRFSSRDYGSKAPSVSVCWSVRSALPVNAQFILFPVRAGAPVSITHELLVKTESAISNLRSEI
ncbi:MAG TPA: alginate lyase family protein [Pyrinomonadaceae bacterium]|nr:alginate lyase family protein [Pyrinomonadaceae bacterium]